MDSHVDSPLRQLCWWCWCSCKKWIITSVHSMLPFGYSRLMLRANGDPRVGVHIGILGVTSQLIAVLAWYWFYLRWFPFSGISTIRFLINLGLHVAHVGFWATWLGLCQSLCASTHWLRCTRKRRCCWSCTKDGAAMWSPSKGNHFYKSPLWQIKNLQFKKYPSLILHHLDFELIDTLGRLWLAKEFRQAWAIPFLRLSWLDLLSLQQLLLECLAVAIDAARCIR